VSLDLPYMPAVLGHASNDPIDRSAEGFAGHGAAGLPDGRQAFTCPRAWPTLDLEHENAVRCEDQIQVAGLPSALTQLTITHAQMLFAVAMEALGAAPSLAIHPHDAMGFPMRSIAHQNF